MKISNAVFTAILLNSVAIEAAPTNLDASSNNANAVLLKREDLERAIMDLEDLLLMREKRQLLEGELAAREYTIVTNVLEAIKDTKLAPVVLKYFTSNVVLQTAAVQGILLVIKSNLINAATLLKYLVQSGLVTSVINDIIADCSFFEQVLQMVKSNLGKIIKRDTPYTHEEGLELLRRDGLIEETIFDNSENLNKRDIDDVIINVLESLAQSGLATQVVEAALTDPQFFRFGALLMGVLYAKGLLKLQSLLSAVSQSGLLPALLEDLLKWNTLKTIATTAVSAFQGKCSASSTTTTNPKGKNTTAVSGTASSTTTKTGSSGLVGSLVESLFGGSGVVSSLLGNLLGKPSGSKPQTSVSYNTAVVTTAISLATKQSIATTIANPCATTAKLFKRERLNLYY